MRTLVVLIFSLWSTASYAIDERDTARHFIPLCKAAASSDEPPQSWEAGMCLGVVRTLLYVKNFLDSKYAYCPPPDASAVKAMQLIISSLEAKPKMLDGDFVIAAMVVLHDKWPCQ
jgi:Rap1a immunity proteins